MKNNATGTIFNNTIICPMCNKNLELGMSRIEKQEILDDGEGDTYCDDCCVEISVNIDERDEDDMPLVYEICVVFI